MTTSDADRILSAYAEVVDADQRAALLGIVERLVKERARQAAVAAPAAAADSTARVYVFPRPKA